MKATIHKVKGKFFVLLESGRDENFGILLPKEQYILKNGIPVYRPKKIVDKTLYENKIITGDIFISRGKKYFKVLQNLGEVELYIENILEGRTFTRISIERYNTIKRLSEEQNKVSYQMTNGFAINKHYICFGNKKEGVITNPFYLKIKDSIITNKL